ncbi:hypothetical protein J4218_04980 [Candidatus Pacearchaeota archaeon]|nr:hypothetical protein [Candidatus Pacearchaeota archaeon]
MGKNAIIKIIADKIGGLTAHKILVKYTNKPESIPHMMSEIENYRGIILDYLTEFNWNTNDKKVIKEKALQCLKNELKRPHFNDVRFPIEEADKLIGETLDEIFE